MLVVVGGALLARTPDFCSSGLLQHGFATINSLARILLPLLAPALLDLWPRDGFAALLAPAPGAEQTAGEAANAAALCTAYQSSSVVLGCTALACSLYWAEARQRKALLAALPAQAGSTPSGGTSA